MVYIENSADPKLKSNNSDNVVQLGRGINSSHKMSHRYWRTKEGTDVVLDMGDLSDRTRSQKCLHGLFRLAQSIKTKERWEETKGQNAKLDNIISADSVGKQKSFRLHISTTTTTITTTTLQPVRFMKLVYEHEKWRSGPFETTHIIGCQETRENLAAPSFTTKETSAKRCAAWMVSHTSL
jgi:hypothetical protein